MFLQQLAHPRAWFLGVDDLCSIPERPVQSGSVQSGSVQSGSVQSGSAPSGYVQSGRIITMFVQFVYVS